VGKETVEQHCVVTPTQRPTEVKKIECGVIHDLAALERYPGIGGDVKVRNSISEVSVSANNVKVELVP